MHIHTVSDAAALPTARLLIHAKSIADPSGTRALLQWLRALCSVGDRYRARPPLRLRIKDINERHMLAIDGAGSLTEVALPAGTYQVTAQLNEERRSYMMTLGPSQSVDLHLPFGPPQTPAEPQARPIGPASELNKSLLTAIERQSASALRAASVILVVLFGIVDYLTGYEIALSIFYIVPIAVVACFVGRRSALAVALLSGLSWTLADVAGHEYANPWVLYWNAFASLLFFVLVAVILDALRTALRYERDMARTDFLTGAANRLAFYEVANRELDRARRYRHPFSLAHIDVDNFKVVNDTLGHQTGDVLLCTIAATMQKNIRDSDTVARLGGDEFVLLLPETGTEDAAIAGKKLHTQLTEEVRRRRWPVSFSVGLLTCLQAPPSVDDLLKSADQLTYRVKERGKNGIQQAVSDALPEIVETPSIQTEGAVMRAVPSA